MDVWLQYHNAEERGLPLDGATSLDDARARVTEGLTELGIVTSKREAPNAIGSLVFMICGVGSSPKTYALWCWFVADDVENDGDQFRVYGLGRDLRTLPALSGVDFNAFRERCGRFGFGFQRITGDPYLPVMTGLAREFGGLDDDSFSEAAERRDVDPIEYLERDPRKVLAIAYDRNRFARQACIDHYGARCFICGWEPGALFGEEFAGVIHVHHRTPVSVNRAAHRISPVQDLVPVCPNCHALIHAGGRTRSADEIAAMFRTRR
jgi:hypothetical protein